MPLVRVSFADNEQAVAMDRQLSDALNHLDRSIGLTRRLLGVSKSKGWKESCQLIWCCFVSFLLLISWMTSFLISSFPLSTYLTLGLCSQLLLIFWAHPNRLFAKALTASSNGVGILRAMPKLLKITNLTYSTTMILSSFLSVLLLLSVLDLLPIFAIPSAHVSLQIALLTGLLISAVVIPTANTLFFSFCYRIVAEFEALDQDFKKDVNTSQLPVCRHYFYAHRSLVKLFYTVSRPLGLWLSVTLLIDFLVLYSCLKFTTQADFSDPGQLWKLFLNGTVLIASGLHVLALILTALKTRSSMKMIRNSVVSLLVGRMSLHEQIYGLSISFLSSLDKTPCLCLFEFFPVRHTSSQLGVLVLVIVFWLLCRSTVE